VGLGGMAFGSGVWTVVAAALFGFSGAAALILGLTLPPLLSKPEQVARTSAAMFTLSYGGAVVTAILCGAAWDLTGIPTMAFAPMGVCVVALVGASFLLRGYRRLV
jgi:MFS transporter, CP family, cyanate transporter